MKGDEKVVRKSWLLAVLALSLCKPQMAVAQVSPQGNETHGMFGNRTLGQPLVPGPSTFGGGIQTGPSGSFLYLGRSDGSAAFATPWMRIDTAVLQQGVGVRPDTQPALNAALSLQSPTPDYNLPELPTIPEFAPPSFLKTNGWEGTSPADRAFGMTPGIGPAAARPQSYTRSPELSDRVTQIARSKGMLPGQGIDVYLSNNIALLHGTVRMPSDRVLLASVLALEPEVLRIDNRLVAFDPTQTLATDPGGGNGNGHPGGGQPSVSQHGTGSAGIHHEASPNPGRTRDAGASMHQSVDAHVSPQSSVGAGTAATPDSWRYRSDNGRWWYWTPQNRWMWYGDDGRWMDYRAETYSDAANAYVVERPILASPPPEANFSGGPITITSPATNKATLRYTLDGIAYTIPPGHSQDLREDRAWVIQFSRGTNFDQARYGLQSGLYSFTSTDHGWELYHTELPTSR